MRELWIATHNDHKTKEFARLLEGTDFTIHSAREIAAYTPPPENGKTFEDNARIKAKSLHAIKPDAWTLSDDSGLEVDGLNNFPGIFSARYAGDHASDAENVAKVLKMLQIRSAGNRKAQFRCVIIMISPEGKEFVFEGKLVGNIAQKSMGTSGFGYDPVFIPEGETQTIAELGPAVKNKISHRAKAIEALRSTIV